jgi:hypothetical protein
VTPEEKKQRERRFVEDIAGRLAWPIRNLVDRERPDFRIDLNDGTVVGLEVVETVDGDAATAERWTDHLCDRIQEQLTAAGTLVMVNLSFVEAQGNLLADTAQMREVAKTVARYIGQMSFPRDGTTCAVTADELQTAGIPFMDGMDVCSTENGPSVLNDHTRQGAHQPFLEDVIREKTLKLASYRKELPEAQAFWLLIVAGAQPGAAFLHGVARRYTYQSGFDRTFYLDRWSDKAFPLTTVPPTTQPSPLP